MRRLLLILSLVFIIVPRAFPLSIDPNGSGGTTYVVSWTDQYNKPRLCEVRKNSSVAPHIQYYDENGNLVNITGGAGFGETVHHGGTMSAGGTTILRFQGAHVAMFDYVQNLAGALEIITYTFMDGHDYFQWGETVDARLGTQQADSRSPYSQINWNGVDGTCATNIDYGMNGYFKMHVTSVDYLNLKIYGPWTVVGYLTAALPSGDVDIPYCREQNLGREIGYIQSQTYQQQLAGDDTMNQSGMFGIQRNPYGTVITPTNAMLFDTQMNFFDCTVKIAWGTPLGFMNNGSNPGDALGRQINGDKNQWGQYSLSCVLDSVPQGGVMRVRNENRAVQSNQFTVTPSIGTMKLEGPVGTSNVNNRQILVPEGWDHNYRTWWAYPDSTQKLQLGFSGRNGTTMVNPTIRIRRMNLLPALVQLNSVSLVEGVDYYADLVPDATAVSGATNEVWITLKRTISGMNNNFAINMQGAPAGIGTSTSNSTQIIPVTGATFNQPYIFFRKALTVTNGINAVFPPDFAASAVTFTGSASPALSFTNVALKSNCIMSYQFTSSLDYSLKPVQFTLKYDPKLIPSGNTESQLMLYSFNGIDWVQIAEDLDMVNHVFRFNSNKLSGTNYLFTSDPNKISFGAAPDKIPDMAQWSYNPFSPNGDGSMDTTRMEIQVTSPAKVSLEIFNRSHVLVRTLVNEQSMSGNTYVEWDGKNNKGKTVAPGAYIYILKIDNVIRKGIIAVVY